MSERIQKVKVGTVTNGEITYYNNTNIFPPDHFVALLKSRSEYYNPLCKRIIGDVELIKREIEDGEVYQYYTIYKVEN